MAAAWRIVSMKVNWSYHNQLISELIHTDDSPTPAGGVALYVSKALTSFPRSDITLDMPLVESVWVEIATPKNQKPILVGCIYKHPGANIDEFNRKRDETHWYYLRFYFLSLLLPIIWTWRCPARKLLLLWTKYTNKLNVFQLIIIYQLLYFPTYIRTLV